MKIPRILPPASIQTVCWLSLLMACLTPVAWAQAVQTPAFLPVEGTALARFPVVVTCPTSGATIRYTVTGAEPTVFDPVVVSGGTVNVARNMTLKAKAWSGGVVSATASSAFEITGDVAAGSQSILALVTNGQVMGWGNQDFGRLSNGSTATTNILAPAAAKYSSSSSIGNASRIASGAKHALMLDSSGNVWGFGNNLLGEAGRATPTELLYAGQVTTNSAGTTFLSGSTKISAGLDFSAALESGGFVRTWGSQVSGRLANGSTATGSRKFADRAKSSSSVELSGIRDIALGKDFGLAREACALETAGALGKVWVWGNNASANLATGNTTAQSYAVKAKLNATTDLTDAWDIDAGDGHSAVVRWKTGDSNLQGSVWTFGSRVNGRLGDNGVITGTASYPVQVQKLVGAVYSPLTGITQVSAGPAHTLALDSAGNVWAWGANSNGALGDNTTVDRKYAVKVRNPGNTADLTNIARVSAGGINGFPSFSTAVAKDGTIYVWGNNQCGVLANGTTSNANAAMPLPVVVTQLKTIPGFPTVSLAAAVTTPNAPGAATLTATVADPQGAATIAKTEFFVQGVLSSTRTASPWTASLTGLAQGTYSAYAKTTDADGNETTSLATSFTIATNPDSDGDGLIDTWENQQFGNLNQTASGDPDNDNVSNLNEYTAGTNPNSNADANADGIPDDWVAWQLAQSIGVPASTLPASGDPDQDELTTLAEFQNGTNPRLLDSDVDGQSDWQELAQATSPSDVNSLAAPFAVSAHKGTSNLQVPMTLLNLTPSNSYVLALSDNFLSTTGFEMTSSNVFGGPDYEWIEISNTGEHLTEFETNPSAMVARTIGFSFPFYGASYSRVFISGQGFATLTDPGGLYPGYPMETGGPLPNVDGHRPLISPYQQYMEPDVQGEIYFKAFPGYIVIQWEQVKLSYFDIRPTFQALLYADGSIRFNYKSIPLDSSGFSISGYLSGIQNAAGDAGIGASWYTNDQQGLAIHNLAPLSLRFGSPPPSGDPWVTVTTTALSGNPLNWGLNFQPSELQPGNHDAVLQFRKNVSSPVLYRRIIRLNVLPAGTSGNDVMDGTSGDDSLSGLGGNDTLHGNDGNDTLNGNDGNDTLHGGAGNDILQGLQGADALEGGEGSDSLDGGAGDDELSGGNGRDLLSGGDGNDILRGQDGSDSINGNAGDDHLYGGSDNDVLTGGVGSDTYHWDVGDGNDTLVEYPYYTQGEINTISFGGDVAPGVEISSQHVKVTSIGPDYGFFTVFDSAGNQIALLTVRNWNDTKGKWRVRFPQDLEPSAWSGLAELANPDLDGVYDIEPDAGGAAGGATNGSDFMAGGTGDDILNGLDGDDQISGQSGKDIIDGGGGGDIISGGEGNDRLLGGSGTDMIHGGSGNDSIQGGQDDDILTGGTGNDLIEGGDGNDTLDGQEGSDALHGGAGDDIIQGGPGDDYLSGDQGSDTYLWNLGDGDDTILDSVGESMETPDENTLILGPGIELHQIKPEFIPATGNNAAFLKVTIVDGADQPVGAIAVQFPSPFNQLSELSLTVRTYGGKTVALATAGRDVLVGPSSGYTVNALAGDDDIRSFAGDDTVIGGEGDDTISCGEGLNTITGGPGNDVIVLTRYLYGGAEKSEIIHYNVGDGHDRILNGAPNHGLTEIKAHLIFGPGISPDDCTFELIEDGPNASAAIKLFVHDDQEQVIGSIYVDVAFDVTSGEITSPYSGKDPISEYVSYGIWKAYSSGSSYHNPGPSILKVEFMDQTVWDLGRAGQASGQWRSDEEGPGDIDWDGMDDEWEITYGLDPLRTGSDESADDPDGDGLTNIKEYVLRKDPRVPDADEPLILEVTGSDGDIMSIAYENQNGLDNSVNDSMDDKDGDGFPNAWEFTRGTRADNANDFPLPDYIVDPANGNLSISDNIVATLGEAAKLANRKHFGAWETFQNNSVILVKAGTYLESVRFDSNVLIYGEAAANGRIPAILGPVDCQTLRLPNDDPNSPESLISGIRISHVPGKLGPAIFCEKKLHLRGVIIDHNVSDLGSAIYGSVSSIEHCSIFNNVSAGGIYFAYYGFWQWRVKIKNSILWGNSDASLVAKGYYGSQDPVTYTVTNSIIEGGFMGALNQDPLLHRSGSLKSTSPAINAITPPAGIPQPRDIHGDDRTVDGLSDIGADEYADDNATDDGDGIPDWVETATDADSLSSEAEYTTHLTDPYLADTDFDGLTDDAEIQIHLTDPLATDTDSDGINDGNEVRIGTSPTVTNNDGDLLPDEWEFDHGLDPTVDDSLLDLDGDGLTNAQEQALGTGPGNKDTDGDGMSDGWEVANEQDPLQASPTPLTVLADGDGDGLVGWAEIAFRSSDQETDTDADGWNDAFEYVAQTNPNAPDSDGDGTPDLDEDSDGDSLSNGDELEVRFTSPISKDTDGDEVDDDREILAQMNPNDPADGGADLDGDGLSTSKELEIGTNPGLKDSDQDGVADGLEYRGGLDPLRSDSDSDGVADLDEDTDGDGLTNRREFELSTHMLYQDTDRDGINDSLEN